MYIKHTQYVNIGMISEDSQDIVYSEDNKHSDHSLIRMMVMMLVVKKVKDPAKERHFLR